MYYQMYCTKNYGLIEVILMTCSLKKKQKISCLRKKIRSHRHSLNLLSVLFQYFTN